MTKQFIEQRAKKQVNTLKNSSRYLDLCASYFPNILCKSNFYLPSHDVSEYETKLTQPLELELYNFKKGEDGFYQDYTPNSPFSFKLSYSGVRGTMYDFYTLSFIIDMFQKYGSTIMKVNEKEIMEVMDIDKNNTREINNLRKSIINLRNTRFNLDIKENGGPTVTIQFWMIGTMVESNSTNWRSVDKIYLFKLGEFFDIMFSFDKFSLIDLDYFNSLGRNNFAKRFFVYLQSNEGKNHLGKNQIISMMGPRTINPKQLIYDTKKRAFDVLKDKGILTGYKLINNRFHFDYENRTMARIKELIHLK